MYTHSYKAGTWLVVLAQASIQNLAKNDPSSLQSFGPTLLLLNAAIVMQPVTL